MLNSRILRNAKLNKFNLSHTHDTTGNMGWLMPVACIEVLPNDWFRIRNEFLVQFLALISPSLSMYNVKLEWWYAPTRLAWPNFTTFITGGEKGEDASVPPYIVAPSEGFAPGSLMNRLGAPANKGNIKVSAIPARLYDLIYNEWYRNEWIQDPLTISLEDGQDTTTSLELQRKLWERDYFTTALPSPQKGPEVTISLGASAPVYGDGNALQFTDGVTTQNFLAQNTNASSGAYFINNTGNSDYPGHLPVKNGESVSDMSQGWGIAAVPTNKALGLVTSGYSGLVADLASASGISINDFRKGAAVQQFQEAAGIDGSRYSEMIPAQYGVFCPDASLQRPQYLGGSSAPVTVSRVLQTSSSTSDSPQANLAGTAVSAGMSNEIKFHSREFGFLFCMMSIMPKTSYFQGVPRFMSRETRYDYAIPLLAHIGEQGIKNKEIFAQGTVADDQIFGYAPRYDEYRTIPSVVTGQLVSTLKHWTSAREFENLPTLSSQFVQANPTDRIFAVQDSVANSDHLVIQVAHYIKALRPLPKQGIPGMHII